MVQYKYLKNRQNPSKI